MKNKVLIIGVVEKNNSVLMRKKPDGSKPYNETWYSFGVEAKEDTSPEILFKDWVSENINIEIETKERLGWDTEIKADHDGEIKNFIYLEILCTYVSGDAQTPEGAEKVEWISKNNLSHYDIVPPSVKLFKRLGYL